MAEAQGVRELRDFAERPTVIREVERPVKARRTRAGMLVLTFLLGVISAVVLGAAALSIFDIRTTISWPAGRIELGQLTAPHVLVVHEQK
jgi:hypothetical protein